MSFWPLRLPGGHFTRGSVRPVSWDNPKIPASRVVTNTSQEEEKHRTCVSTCLTRPRGRNFQDRVHKGVNSPRRFWKVDVVLKVTAKTLTSLSSSVSLVSFFLNLSWFASIIDIDPQAYFDKKAPEVCVVLGRPLILKIRCIVSM